MFSARVALGFLLLSDAAVAQQYTISTVAGNGMSGYSGDGGQATNAKLANAAGVTVDSGGNLYITDIGNHRIRKVSSDGIITTIAGNGSGGYSGDMGSATNAQLNFPTGTAVDNDGNLYIADGNNNRIRKVSAAGIITTVAGSGIPGYSGDDGPATSAQLSMPRGVAIDKSGNLYVADCSNNRIRKINPGGTITTVAGGGTRGFSGDDGPAVKAKLDLPDGVIVTSAGDLYITDAGNFIIRKISTSGIITRVANNGTLVATGSSGPNASQELYSPTSIAVDDSGDVFMPNTLLNLIQRLSTNQTLATVAGTGASGYSGDGGTAINARLNYPTGVAMDSAGNLYVTDAGNSVIRLLQPIPVVTSILNAGSNLSGPISPGEIVVLYGSGLGPSQITEAHLGEASRFGTQLARTTVSFNGILAPIAYSWATQVAAAVPYGITGSTAQVTVTYQGQTAAAFSTPIASSAPGIFTSDGSGKGQAAALNQDNSLNTAGTPARVGDVIVLFATGEGQTNPGGVDGKPATVPLPKPTLPASVTIGGRQAQLQYYGGAPGEIAGVMQINAVIPGGIQTGSAVPVVLQVGNVSSQAGVTIAVR